MNKKYYLAILIIFAMIIGFFWLAKNKQKTIFTEENEDEISILLNNLKNETKINFSKSQTAEFKWKIERAEITEAAIIGKGFEFKGASTKQYTDVLFFFANNGFEMDIYNITAGAMAGLMAYKKDRIACFVLESIWLDENKMPMEGDKRDIKVECGAAGGLIDSFISREEIMKKLFAEKYKTKVSAVIVKIINETNNYIKSNVQILDDSAQGGVGNKGLFLAAKINGVWELAEGAKKYNFSEGAIIETKKGDNFYLILETNPSTGYQWETDFDSDYIKLKNRQYNPPSDESIVGAGGDEIFNFIALKQGEVQITFSYLRPWEKEEPLITKKKIYDIIIK
ncbi:MAG: inhibitor of cysteine peptidase [Parcubacteria group bacterium Athens1014_10]|nr:MAG: inhibitor of cysteine peptidase [Parcubacteria group bacterium Athens1014_10]TSD04877.1 MAG: inhibitor of cysteine peptidase [Parcubacteria group bacterium Athens0714_12]